MTSQPTFANESTGNAAQRAHGSSFYAAMRIMPSDQRKAMFEIYSFCRAVDDIADDQGPGPFRLQQLNRWREDIHALYNGNTPSKLGGLEAAILQFDLARSDFLAVIDGMEMDVHSNIAAPDFATLDLYCDRVASAVGRLSTRVFGLEQQNGIELAHHLGRALQLTNILRDLDEDAAIERLYLPREFLSDAEIKSVAPKVVLEDPRVGVVCDRIVNIAREHFAQADRIMNAYPRRTVRTPRVMSEGYKSILRALVERGWTPPREPVRLSKSRLGLILLRYVLL